MFGGHTFRSLLEAKPAQCAAVAAVAANAGGAGGAGMQRDGPDHQGEGKRQVQAARDIHVHLWKKKNPHEEEQFNSRPVFLSPVRTNEFVFAS